MFFFDYINYVDALEEYKKDLYRISWWIPFKKLRDNYRNNKIAKFKEKYLSNNPNLSNMCSSYFDKRKSVNMPEIRISEEINDENLEKRKIIRDILIDDSNEANSNKYDFHNYFINNTDRMIDKWLFYFDVYERHLSKFRGKDLNILEIGVGHGGSSKMWKHYFTDKYPNVEVNIYCIDINNEIKDLEDEESNIKIFIGSQSDRDFLRKVKSEIPKVDILLDDGGHTMEQQIVTFEEMYEHVKDGGIYLCEDNHTSYFDGYGGDYKKKGTFIEYTKNFIDYLHIYWIYESLPEEIVKFRNTLNSIHYYDSIIVLEKKNINPKYNNVCARAMIGKYMLNK